MISPLCGIYKRYIILIQKTINWVIIYLGNKMPTVFRKAEITNISPFGFWILIQDNEFFIDFKQYPMFYNARISEINDFSTDAMGNFHWESLDIDIEKDAIEHPEKYPLVYE